MVRKMKKEEVKKVAKTKKLKSVYEAALYYEVSNWEGVDKILEIIGKKGGFFIDSEATFWVETASEEERKKMLVKLGYRVD
jgi:hypothetical protein